MNATVGYVEGETCNRNGCHGSIRTAEPDNCSCHLGAPCSACTAPRGYCPECDWEEASDQTEADVVEHVSRLRDSMRAVQAIFPDQARPLDATRIDFRSRSHSSSSMIKEGVYPEGTTQEQVRQAVDGTFGGRFEYFGNGKFKFIAYTD